MHECPVTVFPQQIRWETDGTSRIPFQAYTDEALYRKELDRLFYNGHWCYVGLEAEIPNAGHVHGTHARSAAHKAAPAPALQKNGQLAGSVSPCASPPGP